jgi:hypothetical protein
MFARTALLITAALPLVAQSPARPAYSGAVDVVTEYVPGAAIREGSLQLGDIDTFHTRFQYTRVFKPGEPFRWSVGLAAERFGFGLEKKSLLPTALGSVSVPVGLDWEIDPRWSFRAEVAPGIYSDFNDIGWSDFNAPIIAGVSYSVDDDLQLFLQVSVDARRDMPIVGGPGLRWKINPRWTLSILVPRPRIEYRPDDSWLFYAGAELVGGAYQLGVRHGTERGDAQFDDVNITYREIRAGVGAVWNIGHGFRLEAAGGWMFDRRFLVDERNRQWNGDAAPYSRLQLSYRY